MKIEFVFDASFRQYGKVVEGLHLDELLTALSKTEKPVDGLRKYWKNWISILQCLQKYMKVLK